MKNLILCGPPGSGKTTVGRIAATLAKRTFIDLDDWIERLYAERHGVFRTCREIHRKEGEVYFRQLENECVSLLASKHFHDVIVATGGGVIETQDNIPLLKSVGLLVYLASSVDELYPRAVRKGIPSYLDTKDPYGSFKKLLERRDEGYRRIADKVVNTQSRKPEEIAFEVIS